MSSPAAVDGTIRRVEVACHRLRALRSFYGEHMGLGVVIGRGKVHVTAGTTEIIFHEAEEASDGRYHLAFEVPESLIQEASDWLAFRTTLLSHEGQAVIPSSETWQADSCYAFDPAGNVIELIARHRLSDPTVRPFGPQHIRRVSEVGVVVPDVAAMTARLARRCEIGVWAGVKSPSFTACGSELGLLIVVRRGRSWFPAGPAAAVSPLAVHLQSAKSTSLIDAKLGLRISTGPWPPPPMG